MDAFAPLVQQRNFSRANICSTPPIRCLLSVYWSSGTCGHEDVEEAPSYLLISPVETVLVGPTQLLVLSGLNPPLGVVTNPVLSSLVCCWLESYLLDSLSSYVKIKYYYGAAGEVLNLFCNKSLTFSSFVAPHLSLVSPPCSVFPSALVTPRGMDGPSWLSCALSRQLGPHLLILQAYHSVLRRMTHSELQGSSTPDGFFSPLPGHWSCFTEILKFNIPNPNLNTMVKKKC